MQEPDDPVGAIARSAAALVKAEVAHGANYDDVLLPCANNACRGTRHAHSVDEVHRRLQSIFAEEITRQRAVIFLGQCATPITAEYDAADIATRVREGIARLRAAGDDAMADKCAAAWLATLARYMLFKSSDEHLRQIALVTLGL